MKDFIFEESYSFHLHKTWLLLRLVMQRRLSREHPGISFDYWMILDQLYVKDGRIQSDLARLTMKDFASITRMIDGMAARGLVTRQADPNDRRATRIYLTEKSRKLEPALKDLAASTMSSATRGMGADQTGTLVSILKELQRNLNG